MEVEARTEVSPTPATPQPFIPPPPPPSQLEREQAQVPPPEDTPHTAAAVAGIQEGVVDTASSAVVATTATATATDKDATPIEEGSLAAPAAAATLTGDSRAEEGGGAEGADSKEGVGGEGREGGGGKEGVSRPKRPREKDLPVSERQGLTEVVVQALLVVQLLRVWCWCLEPSRGC